MQLLVFHDTIPCIIRDRHMYSCHRRCILCLNRFILPHQGPVQLVGGGVQPLATIFTVATTRSGDGVGGGGFSFGRKTGEVLGFGILEGMRGSGRRVWGNGGGDTLRIRGGGLRGAASSRRVSHGAPSTHLIRRMRIGVGGGAGSSRR